MFPAKSLPAFLDNICIVKAIYSKKDDGEIDKEKYKTDKDPFQNTSKFYHKDVPLVSVCSSALKPPVIHVIKNMNTKSNNAIKEPSCHKSPIK